ncbi:putative quinol monooxygenase [Flammeovirga sp. SJP92]|uniref:putative quinol monooxygenase n=1 Tax=Flammeovirga sp. SJP92 TaxID=1775430 RepID=UPI0007868636|nr:putative quinol monooxygenase [Flammeovirga sp. SJP92]KXX66507.1 hypothetical protein AVL50_31770 [Flammeovirga sp. SJP92]
MIIVTVKASPKQGYKKAFLDAFNEVSSLVLQEKGCIEYSIYQKDAVSNHLFLFEKWESQEALDEHMATDHMKDFFTKVTPWFEGENDMEVYQIKD